MAVVFMVGVLSTGHSKKSLQICGMLLLPKQERLYGLLTLLHTKQLEQSIQRIPTKVL